MTVDLNWVKEIKFNANPETLVTIIVTSKTESEALEKARNLYWYIGSNLDRSNAREDAWIGIMKYKDYCCQSTIYIPKDISNLKKID
jgi:hypothetical protein